MRKYLATAAIPLLIACSQSSPVTQTPQAASQQLPGGNQPAGLQVGSEVELYEPKRTYVMCAQSPEILKLAVKAWLDGDQEGMDTLQNEGSAGLLPNYTQLQIDEIEGEYARCHGIKGSVIGKAMWAPLKYLRKIQPK